MEAMASRYWPGFVGIASELLAAALFVADANPQAIAFLVAGAMFAIGGFWKTPGLVSLALLALAVTPIVLILWLLIGLSSAGLN